MGKVFMRNRIFAQAYTIFPRYLLIIKGRIVAVQGRNMVGNTLTKHPGERHPKGQPWHHVPSGMTPWEWYNPPSMAGLTGMHALHWVMSKHQTNPKWEMFHKIIVQDFSKVQRSGKINKDWGNVRDWRPQRKPHNCLPCGILGGPGPGKTPERNR